MRQMLATLGVALALACGDASAEPAMWTAHGPHADLVMFGSVHLLPKAIDWQPAKVKDAIAQADEIWFELPIDDQTAVEVQRLAASKGLLAAGDNLFSHLNGEEQGHLRGVCQNLGISCEVVARMRPWLAEVTVSVAADMRAGALASQGVEQQVAAEAPATAHRRAFETVSQQIGFLADPSAAEQVRSLDETVEEIADDPGIYDRVLKEWLAGDLTALSHDALDPVAKTSPSMYRRLITERNQRWAKILGQALTGEGKIVVVVGAGHLIGPGGVPALLRQQGFTVEGPDAH
ncbi:MAG TPA: TraB/GumN family protein [Caulobacteraceae bacterium]